MSQNAFIQFVEGSTVPSVTLEELKQQLVHYRDQYSKTGTQLGWDYADSAFPYSIEQKADGEGKWFYLKGTGQRYRYIVMGIGSKVDGESEQHFVQVVLPDDATYGDKSKANEFCKYLGKTWLAETHLFNGRIMYFNPRK